MREYHQQEEVGDRLPPGFRFSPTDEELILCYLKKKLDDDEGSISSLMVDFDIYSCNPWELPRHLCNYPTGEQKEMYFFTPTHPPSNSVAGGGLSKRCGRNAGCGVWHGSGKDHLVKNWDEAAGKLVVVGHKTFFNFQKIVNAPESASNKLATRIKTDWLMYEYRLHSVDDRKRGIVLCKIYEKTKARKDCSSRETWLPDDNQDGLLKRKRAVEDTVSAVATPPWSPDTPLLLHHPEQQNLSSDCSIGEGENQSTIVPMKRRRVVEQPEHENVSSYNSLIMPSYINDDDSDTDELLAGINLENLEELMSSLKEVIGNGVQVQSPIAMQAAGFGTGVISDVAYPNLPLAMSDATEMNHNSLMRTTDVLAIVPADDLTVDLSPLEDEWWDSLGSIA